MAAGADSLVVNPLQSGRSSEIQTVSTVRRAAGQIAREETSAVHARRALRRFLSVAGAVPEDEFNILLAAGEVVSNAIRYGHGDHVRWTASASASSIEVVIEYASDQFDTTESGGCPTGLSERGRGILLMRSVMDEAHFQFAGGTVQVLLVKRRTG